MYGWLFRHLPGPTWLKAIDAVILVVIIVLSLFQWVFPWISDVLNLTGNTVS